MPTASNKDTKKPKEEVVAPKKKTIEQLSEVEIHGPPRSALSRLITALLFAIFMWIFVPVVYLLVHSKNTPIAAFVSNFKDKKLVSYGCVGVVYFISAILSVIPLILYQLFSPAGWGPNATPRETQSRMTGWGKRAAGAHYNSIEALPGFAAGVIIALNAGVDATLVAKLAVTFVALRVVYHFVYLFNISSFGRTAIWTGTAFIVTSLFILPFYPELYSTPPAQLVGPQASHAVNDLLAVVNKQLGTRWSL